MKNKFPLLLMFTIIFAGCTGAPKPVQSTDMVANADPYEIGIVGASFSDFTGFGQDLGSFTLYFAPRTNEVILEMTIQGNKTQLHLDKKDRELLISSIISYFEMFDERSLDAENDMLDAYGTFPAFMRWGMLSLNAEGTASVSIGYEFVKDAPYFTLTVPETSNDRYGDTLRHSTAQRSGYFQIFFTRSQIGEFGDMILQEYLESTLEEKNVSRASVDADVY